MTSTSMQPQGPTNPHHRKIELQSPLDLTYLQANLWRCAQQKVDSQHTAGGATTTSAKPAEFISLGGGGGGGSGSGGGGGGGGGSDPPDAAQSDEKKQSREKEQADVVRALVSAFLSRTWANALPSISINGLDVPPSAIAAATAAPPQDGQSHSREDIEGVDYRYAAFDGKLQQRVASLYAEVEALTAQVSRLRREAPARGAAAYAEAVRGAMDEDDGLWQQQQQQRRQRQAEDDGDDEKKEHEQQIKEEGLPLEEVRSGWHENVQSMYERGVDDLVRLAGLKRNDGGGGGGGSADTSLTETVGKAQRARSVAMEFE